MTSAIINASKTAVFKGNRFEKKRAPFKDCIIRQITQRIFFCKTYFFFIDHKKTLNISFFSAQKLD